MANEIKRVNYYDQQFLREGDFTAEQTYHMEMRRRHNRLLHGWGIVEELKLELIDAKTIKVTNGMAIDKLGREIILDEQKGYDEFSIPSDLEDGNYYITIEYEYPEPLSDPPPAQDMVTPEDRTRVVERPKVSIKKNVIDAGITLILGSAKLIGEKIDGSISPAGRKYIPGVLPSGTIVMWSGIITNIPSGWALCDGRNGTPDLRDRFIVGAGRSYPLKEQGGLDFVELKIDHMPMHSHVYRDIYFMEADGWVHDLTVEQGHEGRRQAGNYGEYDYDNWGFERICKTEVAGTGNAHENRPPYFALYFIMKK